MADLEKLKSVRSRAQASFTKWAHNFTKPGLLEPTEIGNGGFSTDFSKVTDAGHEYVEALRESKEEEVIASADQMDTKTVECENRFLEVKRAAQETFWTGYAEEAFFNQAKTAASAITQAEEDEVNPLRSNKDRKAEE